MVYHRFSEEKWQFSLDGKHKHSSVSPLCLCHLSGCPSLWPWPKSCTTPQEDRGWPGPGTLYYPMDVDDLPAAGGSRPDRLAEVRPQERVQRHTVEQIILAPMLDVPVPLMEEQILVDAFLEVPKILPYDNGTTGEVPRIISFSSLQRIVEQNVDIPVPRGGVRGLQGFHQGQASTTSSLSGTYF